MTRSTVMSSERELQSLRRAFLELQGIPPPLRPLSRAFILGYAFSVTPRLLTTLLQFVSRLRQRRAASNQKDGDNLSTSLKRILKTGFDWRRFPTFCAVLVGGSTLLEVSRIARTLSSTCECSIVLVSTEYAGEMSSSCDSTTNIRRVSQTAFN